MTANDGFRLSSRPLLHLACVISAAGPLHAAPDGGSVTAGSAAITGAAGTTTIHQSSDRAIIRWNQFSIGAGESVNFVMPSAHSAVLNRVTGSGISTIDGSLTGNGHVYLLNPNGVVIGSNGVVTTGSFVAGTGTVLDEEFLAGRQLTIRGANGGIRNDGRIEATTGDVVLAAREIDNRGTIQASGTVALGAGTEVTLTRTGDGGMSVRVAGEGKIDQSGTIEAARAELRAAGGNPYSLAINHDGVTRATGAVKSGGKVILTGGSGGVRIGGKLQASGGKVAVTGRRVEIDAGAEVDVSGSEGGGRIDIGRDDEGNRAEAVAVASGAKLAADAFDQGDGGRITVWSDRFTRFDGELSVQGAGTSGAGGFAEVSSAEMLDFTGTARLGGSGGSNGTLLLDPTDMTIGAAQAASIVSSLASGNVVVATSSAGSGAGNLTIGSAISYTSANDLFFLAHGNVRVNATVRNAGTGDITAIAGWDGTTGATGNVDGAGFLAMPGSYGNNGGSIFVGSATQTTATSFGSKDGDLFLGGSSLTVAGGNTANAYSQVGWHAVDQGAAHTVTGDIALALKGNLALQAGSADRTNAQIGHGGATTADNTSTDDGTFSGNITATVAGATTLTGSNTATGHAQIGHGGLSSRGGKTGSILLETASLSAVSGTSFGSYTQVGHGGWATSSPAYGGAITVHSAGNITLTSGTSQLTAARIGHGSTTTTGATGDIEVTALDLLMNMKASGQSISQIGHGGSGSGGTFGGNIGVAVRDLTMDTTGQTTLALIGHGGGLSGTITGNVAVQARDVSMFVNGNNGGAMQIGHLTGSGSMTGTTTLNARDIVMRAGSTGAVPRIGMGAEGGGTANATGNIIVNGRNLTMTGGNSFTSFTRIGHGGLLQGVVQGNIDIVISGETSMQAGSGAVPLVGHSTTSQNGQPKSNVSLTTGTLDDSATATATSVTLRNNVLSVFREAAQFGDTTVTATGLNGNDGLLLLDSAYTGFSPYQVTFASTKDLTVQVPVTFQPTWTGNIHLLFGQAAGGTLRLNAAVSTPGTGTATIRGGLFDDTVILGNGGSIEGTIDGGGGVNTLTGDANANAFSITGVNSGTLTGKTAGWLNFQNLFGGDGNDTFTFTNAGSLTGTISGDAGSNTLTGDADGNLFTITSGNFGTLEGKASAWRSIQILNGGSGSDRFVFGPAGSINTINAGGGSDFLQLPDSGGQLTVTGVNSGTARFITSGWSNVENLTGGSGTDTFAFANAGRLDGSINGNGGGDVLRGDNDGNQFIVTAAGSGLLEGKLSSWSGISALMGGTGNDTLIGTSLADEFVISGSNAGTITGLGLSWSAIGNLAGGSGDDTFRFAGTGSLTGSLTGNSGRNRVVAPDSGGIFELYGQNSGRLVDRVGSDWVGIHDLAGGTGNDTFRFFNLSSLTGQIQGGGGLDTLQGDNFGEYFVISGANSGALEGKVGHWSGISILLGGNGNDIFLFEGGSLAGGSIIGGEGNNDLRVTGSTGTTFLVTGANQGSITGLVDSWTNLRSLTGGTGNDRFEIAAGGSLSGKLDGGSGIDTLAAIGAPAYFQITGENFGHLNGALQGWQNIDVLEGSTDDDIFLVGGSVGLISGMGGNDTLTTYRPGAEFLVEGINSGSMGSVLWQGIENLIGGDGRDLVRFIGAGRIDGIADGGAGNNRLDYSQADSGIAVDLEAGTASRTGGIANFTEAIGSAFADFLRSGPLGRLLDGGAGDDALEIHSTDHDAVSVTVLGGAGNNELTFTFADSLSDSTVNLLDGVIVRQWNSGSEQHEFSDISLLRLIAGGASDRVQTAGFAFAQDLDGGGGNNTLVLDGRGYGLVNPASPVAIGDNGLITHVNFGEVDLINAATPEQVRQIIAASSADFDLSERSALLRLLWFLDSTDQAPPRGGFKYLDLDGKPIEPMAGATEAR